MSSTLISPGHLVTSAYDDDAMHLTTEPNSNFPASCKMLPRDIGLCLAISGDFCLVLLSGERWGWRRSYNFIRIDQ